MNYLVGGQSPQRMGNAHPNVVPYQDFPSADGHFIIAVGNDGQFAKLAHAMDRPDWAADPAYATNAARVANRAGLIAKIKAVSIGHTTAHWVTLLEQAGVPCGPINTLADVFADPQVTARGTRMAMTHGTGAELALVANPIRMSATPAQYRRPPPGLGEHTRAVLAERLGLDAAEMDKLAAAGAI